jgi:hypothetical protein
MAGRIRELLGFDTAWTKSRVRVALVGELIVGFGTARALDGDAVELDDLFVDPAWTRPGVARALLSDAVAAARVDGVSRIEVMASVHANAFAKWSGSSWSTRRSGPHRACTSISANATPRLPSRPSSVSMRSGSRRLGEPRPRRSQPAAGGVIARRCRIRRSDASACAGNTSQSLRPRSAAWLYSATAAVR